MKLYTENVEDYLAEYGTLTRTLVFSPDGEALFSDPPSSEFGRRHLRAALSCMADSLHPLAGIQVGDVIYKCLRVDSNLLVGHSDKEEMVAFRSEDVIVVGFNDRARSGDCCLTDVKNVAELLFRPPPEELEDGDPLEEEEHVVTQATMLQATQASPRLAKPPRVSFTDKISPVPQRSSKTKLLSTSLPLDQSHDLEVVNAAFESHQDEEESFERIELDEAPTVTPEEIQLKDLPPADVATPGGPVM